MRTIDAMIVDLLVQVLPKIRSPWEAMNSRFCVLEKAGKFPAIGTFTIEIGGPLPVFRWLRLFGGSLSLFIDTELSKFAFRGSCQFARFHKLRIAGEGTSCRNQCMM